MRTTNRHLYLTFPALLEISKLPMPIAVAWPVKLMMEEVHSLFRMIEAQRISIAKKHGATELEGQREVPEAGRPGFDAEIDELLGQEVEVFRHTWIPLSVLIGTDFKTSPAILAFLFEWVLVDDRKVQQP